MNPNSGQFTSNWPDLPPELLGSIASRICPVIGILRLRSVCPSWRSSLSLTSSSPHFPLNLPPYPFSPPSSTTHISLIRRTVFLLTSPANPSAGFLVKIQELNPNPNPNSFSLFDPLSKLKKEGIPSFQINLLDYGVCIVCHSYVVVENVGFRVHENIEPEFEEIWIKKVVVIRSFFEEGDFVVLGLTESGLLLLWRFGDEAWTEIGAKGRCFDDVISYRGKFYATADKRGRLVMIDSRLKPVDMVHSLMYGCEISAHLVESDGNLYLVDRVSSQEGLQIVVFKLDENRRNWDYTLNLNDIVFFVGDDVNFSLSKKDYNGSVRNCIYFIDEDDEGEGFTAIFDMKLGTICPVLNSMQLGALYGPPSSLFSDFREVDSSSS